ncbi:hypothetical protein [Saliphagus infecundisoli]|uniref:Uncharacterized protein n=1 Tax=Saliphagus infecundisoli TaxID=1849069 RepID=A0ABD5QBP8_9EURY|nr:hypothetical protein [Saliphagus infecundisoli]
MKQPNTTGRYKADVVKEGLHGMGFEIGEGGPINETEVRARKGNTFIHATVPENHPDRAELKILQVEDWETEIPIWEISIVLREWERVEDFNPWIFFRQLKEFDKRCKMLQWLNSPESEP